MSRKAKLPVLLKSGIEAKVDGTLVTVKGPKGTLTQEVMKGVVVEVGDEGITVSLAPEMSHASNFLGLYWSLISNMVTGVSDGYQKELQMIGVGFRAAVQGRVLDLQVGYSHPTKMPIPEGIEVTVEKNVNITVKGINKQQVGQFAADIRAKRRPEPYKGKGVRYKDEHVRKKAGKAGKK